MFKQNNKQIYVNQDQELVKKVKLQKKNIIYLSIVLVATSSLIWMNNYNMFVDLLSAKNDAIVIYNTIHSNRIDREIKTDQEVYDGPEDQEENRSDVMEEVSQLPPDMTEVEKKICDTFTSDCKIMIAIAHAESGLNPGSINTKNNNGSIDVGLFQINSIHGYSKAELLNVDFNLQIAKAVYDNQGITAWSAYNNGSYKKYL